MDGLTGRMLGKRGPKAADRLDESYQPIHSSYWGGAGGEGRRGGREEGGGGREEGGGRGYDKIWNSST